MDAMTYVLAVDLGGTQIRAALCDAQGSILRREAALTSSDEGLPAVLERIVRCCVDALGGVGIEEIAGVGVGAPGPLNPNTGIVLEAPNLRGWKNVPLRALLAERLGRPTFLGNDANLAALAEHTHGAARQARDMIYLTVSTGIGSGIISNGQLLLGVNGLGAEAGHMIIDMHGPQCGCGNQGCLEAFASGPAITRDVVARLRLGKKSSLTKISGGDLSRIDARMISEAAQGGDRLARKSFVRAGRALGVGIVNLLHLFNPRMVVLGGSVTKAGPFLFDPLETTVRALAGPYYLDGLSIVQAALGDDVGLLGAAALAINQLGLSQTAS
jgi:glucokinase